jgi:hypothetical protein
MRPWALQHVNHTPPRPSPRSFHPSRCAHEATIRSNTAQSTKGVLPRLRSSTQEPPSSTGRFTNFLWLWGGQALVVSDQFCSWCTTRPVVTCPQLALALALACLVISLSTFNVKTRRPLTDHASGILCVAGQISENRYSSRTTEWGSGVAVKLLTRVLEALGSYLGRYTGYLHWGLPWYSLVPPGKFRESSSMRSAVCPSKSFPIRHSCTWLTSWSWALLEKQPVE